MTEQGLREYCKKFKDYDNIKRIEFIHLEFKKKCSVLFEGYNDDTVTMTLKHLLERYNEDKLFLSKKRMLDSDFNKKIEDIFKSKYLKLLNIKRAKK